ncbi:MAG: YlmC/YmxH family sporulation protein [Peptococcaceae bacterium]|nr:MAG: YlmC/YmxH family sporulation protein [Peptococcaceae bacterium]
MLFKISELGMRDIVNLADGAKLGPVRDVHIDLETGQVRTLVLSPSKKYLGFFRAGREVMVSWENVRKIGVDTVLVELNK